MSKIRNSSNVEEQAILKKNNFTANNDTIFSLIEAGSQIEADGSEPFVKIDISENMIMIIII